MILPLFTFKTGSDSSGFVQYWMNQRRFFGNDFFTRNLLIQRLLRYAVGTVYVLNIGFWRSPTSVFEVGFEKSDSKLVSWHQLALLAAVANSKIFVQKNNRPLQVELENGRSRLQNDFQIFESMLRGFIAPASNADVYTSAYFALQNTCWEHPNPWTASGGCRLF